MMENLDFIRSHEVSLALFFSFILAFGLPPSAHCGSDSNLTLGDGTIVGDTISGDSVSFTKQRCSDVESTAQSARDTPSTYQSRRRLPGVASSNDTYVHLASLLSCTEPINETQEQTQVPSRDIASHFNTTDTHLSKVSRESTIFYPLKDASLADKPMAGTTWFMSSLHDATEKDETEYLFLPSKTSKGRILCLKGRDTRDGARNSYALAWPDALPNSSTFLKGLTFVSNIYYDYVNLYHGLSAVSPFVGWSMKNGCLKPERWMLFHWGELRGEMGSWVHQLMEANFGEVNVERFEGKAETHCFEKAVVMRHNLGKMGKEKRIRLYGQLRCKARMLCGVDTETGPKQKVDEKEEVIIRLTLFMRKGSRSFKNETAVVEIFAKECGRVQGCTLKVVQSDGLSFCEQVILMAETDILVSPHGAQLTNMIFMDQNSNVMEFFPQGWQEFAGVGQYVYHWLADQSGMKHRGAWWDPMIDEKCPFPVKDRKCFPFYKGGQVGHNTTYFTDWSRYALTQVKMDKLEQLSPTATARQDAYSRACEC